jgi:hypothetical protein
MSKNKKYGTYYKNRKGYKVKPGASKYNHIFGGSDWTVVDKSISFDGPELLLTLDLHDPYLDILKRPGLIELPLCSYLNSNIWEDEQIFQIIPENKEIHLISKAITTPNETLEADKLPNPLPRRDVYLEVLNYDESPLDEDSYWDACDMFLGGTDFIRVLQPLWLQNVEFHKCTCGKEMIFTACIGYENYEITEGFIGNRPFFLGEGALYFFLCPECLIIKSTCQSS